MIRSLVLRKLNIYSADTFIILFISWLEISVLSVLASRLNDYVCLTLQLFPSI